MLRGLKTAAHGVAGGARSVLSGGTFKAGFSSAGFTQAFAPDIDQIPDGAGGAGQLVAAGVVGGTASELAGGEFEDGFVTGVFGRAFNHGLHKGSLRETEQERMLRENDDPAGYYAARAARGDHYAETALGVVLDDTPIGWMANKGLQGTAALNGVEYNDLGVNIDLMNAHAGAVASDTSGTIGLLSPSQIASYHHDIFGGMGLPNSTFGGTPITGTMFDLTLTAPIWCSQCDAR